MAKSTSSMASMESASVSGGDRALTERAVITMTGGQRPTTAGAWLFLWEGITVPLKFDPAPVSPPPPAP